MQAELLGVIIQFFLLLINKIMKLLQAAEIFVYELIKYKRDRMQYKQTKKHPEKSKEIINRLKR